MMVLRVQLLSFALMLSFFGALMYSVPVPAYANSHPQAVGGGIQNPLSGISSVSQFVEKVLQGLLLIGMPLVVFFIVLAGFKFITAQGNQEKLTAARQNFMYTIIGSAVFIGAWALAQLIASTLKQIGVGA